MTIPPNVKYAELFEELYQEAREQGRGLWKGQGINDDFECDDAGISPLWNSVEHKWDCLIVDFIW